MVPSKGFRDRSIPALALEVPREIEWVMTLTTAPSWFDCSWFSCPSTRFSAPSIGELVGETVGELVGETVGELVGAIVGSLVGAIVGALVGLAVGTSVGELWFPPPQKQQAVLMALTEQ